MAAKAKKVTFSGKKKPAAKKKAKGVAELPIRPERQGRRQEATVPGGPATSQGKRI